MFQFGVLLDPLSENAQTWSTMLEVSFRQLDLRDATVDLYRDAGAV